MDQNVVLLEMLQRALAPKPPDYLGDLIKIGLPLLGALIAGGFMMLNTNMTLTRDSRQRYALRRRDSLEKVLQTLVDFDKTYRHQKAAFQDLGSAKLFPDGYQERVMQFNKWHEALRVKMEVFADISGVLLLLGEPQAEKVLEEYRKVANEWYEKSFLEAGKQESQELESLRKSIIEKREGFMAELARIYKHE